MYDLEYPAMNLVGRDPPSQLPVRMGTTTHLGSLDTNLSLVRSTPERQSVH